VCVEAGTAAQRKILGRVPVCVEAVREEGVCVERGNCVREYIPSGCVYGKGEIERERESISARVSVWKGRDCQRECRAAACVWKG